MKNLVEDEFSKFWIDEGIVQAVYKQDLVINLNIAKKIVTNRLLCQNYQPFPVFADYRGLKNIDKEARDYLALEGSQHVIGCAVLITSVVQKTMGNFYLNLNKPPVPTKIFTNKSEAMEWLRKTFK